MRYSPGYSPEHDMGNDKEVIAICAVETRPGAWYVAHNGQVPGDSRGLTREAANAKINDMCDILFCCVVYVKRPDRPFR